MRNNHTDYSFAQNVIAELIGESTSMVSRLIKEIKVERVNSGSNNTKKYSLSDTGGICQKLLVTKKFTNKIHVFYNLKGGTGKTSIGVQLASHLSIMGYKVLVVDIDPQGHMTNILGFPEEENHITMYDVIVNDVNIHDAVVNVYQGLDAVLSNLSLSRVEVPLSQKNRREEKLCKVLSLIKDKYDFIMIDTNPSCSTLNLNALYCADQVNFICETAPFSLYGLRVMLAETTAFFDDMNKRFKYKIIPNKYESKTITAQEVLGYLRTNYKEHVTNSIVRKCEDINIASKECKPIAAFCKRKSPAFEDIKDLIHEFINLSQNPKRSF